VDLETGEEHLLGANRRDSMGKSEVEMRSMSPPWVAVVERVKDSIMKMKERLSSLQKLQQRRLLRVFDEDGGKGDIDVENTSSAITNLLHQSERGIKELDRYVVSGEQQEVVLNVQKALATQLSQVSMDFRTVQKQYMNEVRKRRSNSSSIGETSTAGVIDAGFTENQLLELEGIESQVETRSQEITKIAKSINELNSVFKELANLVVEQGTVLDRIDYNMENVAKDTAAANKELVRADETQKSGRVQKCLLALIAFIILNLLILTARA
jgi:syntaxin 16